MQLDGAAIAAFAAQLSPTSVQSSAVYVRLPIRFDSLSAEVGGAGRGRAGRGRGNTLFLGRPGGPLQAPLTSYPPARARARPCSSRPSTQGKQMHSAFSAPHVLPGLSHVPLFRSTIWCSTTCWTSGAALTRCCCRRPAAMRTRCGSGAGSGAARLQHLAAARALGTAPICSAAPHLHGVLQLVGNLTRRHPSPCAKGQACVGWPLRESSPLFSPLLFSLSVLPLSPAP